MSVIRIKKDKNYFAASNVPFNDENLSWEARGVMGYLLSKPDNWHVMFNDLVNRGPAGAHKMRRILKELEEAGYLKRERLQDDDGKFVWQSTIYEVPISRKPIYGETISRLSIDGSSIDGKPRDILSTESPSINKQNTKDKEGGTPKRSRKRDARLDNPAIQAYREEMRLHVPIAWRDEVVTTVTDFDLWEKTIHDWNGLGWNKTNVKGMLEAYRKGGIQDKRNGNNRPGTFDALEELAKEGWFDGDE